MQTRRLVTWLIGFLSWNVLTKDSQMIKLIKEWKCEKISMWPLEVNACFIHIKERKL